MYLGICNTLVVRVTHIFNILYIDIFMLIILIILFNLNVLRYGTFNVSVLLYVFSSAIS